MGPSCTPTNTSGRSVTEPAPTFAQPFVRHSQQQVQASPRQDRHYGQEAEDEAPCCWICLNDGGDLEAPCACPRVVHRQCLARWQLQKAGTSQEKACRFCYQTLPDWRDAYVLPREDVHPMMAIVCGDVVHKIRVRPGAAGAAEFQARVKQLFGFPQDRDFDVTFTLTFACFIRHSAKECHNPSSAAGDDNNRLVMKGLHCYSSAAHCAAHFAAARTSRRDTQC